MEIKQIKKSWREFETKMASLSKQQVEILANISKKIDQKHMEIIRGKLKK
ncbi:MAG TPA: hypothetical protein P5262_03280 [Candidatus Moranbacteria bacterium]|nr:hypothetical protein [Candidatus Moranbacteria bacterium]